MFPISIISSYGNIAPKDEYSFYIQPNEDINSTEVIETKNRFLFYRRSGSGSVQYNDKLGKSLYLPSGTSFYNASTGASQISLDFNNNFEISFRANILSQGSDYNVLFCRYNNNSNSGSWIVAISNPGSNGYRKLEFSYTTDGTSNTLQRVISSTEFTFNTEVDIIIRRIGSTLVMYQNGIQVATKTINTVIYTPSTIGFSIGTFTDDFTSSFSFNGYLSDIKIRIGPEV